MRAIQVEKIAAKTHESNAVTSCQSPGRSLEIPSVHIFVVCVTNSPQVYVVLYKIVICSVADLR